MSPSWISSSLSLILLISKLHHAVSDCNYFYILGHGPPPIPLDSCAYSRTGFSYGYYCRQKENGTYVRKIEFDVANCPDNRGTEVQEFLCNDYDCNCDGSANDCKVARITKRTWINSMDKACNESTKEKYYYAYDICFNLGIIGGQYFKCDRDGVNEIYYDNDDCTGNLANTPSPITNDACYEIECNYYRSAANRNQFGNILFLLVLIFIQLF